MTHAGSSVLYRDEDLLVRRGGGHGSLACVVTFDSYTDVLDLDRPAFGEHFLAGEHIDAVHVLSRSNRWYQHSGMEAACASVRAAVRDYDRVVAYGSSMGGYAALRLAGLVGARTVLALSPQWTIDWRRVPWERRWAESSRVFEDVWESSVPPPPIDEAFVIFDPLLRDRRHVEGLERDGYRFQRVEIPGGGHPVGGFLAEIGLLRPAVLDVVAGRFNPGQWREAALRGRAGSAQALLAESSRVSKARIGRRLALLQRAARIAPSDPIVLSRLALELAWAGRPADALAHHRRALEIQPEQPTLLMHLSCILEIAGDREGARRVMAEVCTSPTSEFYRPRLDALSAPVAAGRRWPRWLRRMVGARPSPLAGVNV